MSTGNGIPPLPKAPSAPVTESVELTLPGDLLRDLKQAAQQQGMELDVAVAMCVQLWRHPPAAVAAQQRRRVPKKGG